MIKIKHIADRYGQFRVKRVTLTRYRRCSRVTGSISMGKNVIVRIFRGMEDRNSAVKNVVAGASGAGEGQCFNGVDRLLVGRTFLSGEQCVSGRNGTLTIGVMS